MSKLFTIGGIITVGFFMGWFGKLELAQNGQTQYVIVKSANPTPAEQFAAEDLSAYLQKITGARFPHAKAGDKDAICVERIVLVKMK